MDQALQTASAAAAVAASCRIPPFIYTEQSKVTTNAAALAVEGMLLSGSERESIESEVTYTSAAALAIEGMLSSGSERENIEPEFNRLVRLWKSERSSTSSTIEMAMHPAYQEIIGLGKAAIPFILRELSRESDFWFWALKAISREDPVPPRSRGRIREMTDIWLDWGRRKGYVR
jgi:hypothetical protein